MIDFIRPSPTKHVTVVTHGAGFWYFFVSSIDQEEERTAVRPLIRETESQPMTRFYLVMNQKATDKMSIAKSKSG
jgi:hypothetical protein